MKAWTRVDEAGQRPVDDMIQIKIPVIGEQGQAFIDNLQTLSHWASFVGATSVETFGELRKYGRSF